MGKRYANILETVGNTPVVKINRLAPPGVDLYVKVEAFNPLGSVKDRLALGVIEDAERTGKLKPGQTVVEATSGNTGIGLAMVCAQKGYPLVVTMAETFSIERRKLMRFLGAKVVLTPAASRAVGMVNKTIELAEKHGWFYTRQFENEANADMHSKTTAREILDDFAGERLDYWVTGFGTGGTLKGVARVLAKERPETKIVVCEPEDAPMLSSGVEQERNPERKPGAEWRIEAVAGSVSHGVAGKVYASEGGAIGPVVGRGAITQSRTDDKGAGGGGEIVHDSQRLAEFRLGRKRLSWHRSGSDRRHDREQALSPGLARNE